jgi:hypothetical protein
MMTYWIQIPSHERTSQSRACKAARYTRLPRSATRRNRGISARAANQVVKFKGDDGLWFKLGAVIHEVRFAGNEPLYNTEGVFMSVVSLL